MVAKERETMLEVSFLGTGSAFSTDRRTNIALLVREGDTNFLIECGPTILYQLNQAGSAVDQISHLFVSHRHGDHILGLPMFLLMRSMGGAPGSLDILGSEDVIRAGKELAHLVYPELDKRLDSITWVGMPADRPTSVEPGPSFKLSTLPMPHMQNVPVLGLRLDFQNGNLSIVYTGDTTYNEETAAFAAGCDLLVHEANFSEALQPGIKADNYGHCTARQAGRTASKANCRLLALVHLSPDYAGCEDEVRADAAQEFDGQIIVPSDGTTIYL
jgi:ribonuclease Z